MEEKRLDCRHFLWDGILRTPLFDARRPAQSAPCYDRNLFHASFRCGGKCRNRFWLNDLKIARRARRDDTFDTEAREKEKAVCPPTGRLMGECGSFRKARRDARLLKETRISDVPPI